MKKQRILLLLLAAATLALAGCVSLGPPFTEEPSIPEGTALVYIYRPGNFVGSAVSYLVYANETPVVELYNGGYFPYFADPGAIRFWAKTESESSVTIEVAAGQRYFVKGTVGMGFFVGRPYLTFVPQESGQIEIMNCKRIQ
jgi:hypothetical protein